MNTRNNSFWSLRARNPLRLRRFLHHPRLTKLIVSLALSIALTALGAYLVKATVTEVPESRGANWIITLHTHRPSVAAHGFNGSGVDSLSLGLCNSVGAVMYPASSVVSRGFPLPYYYHVEGVGCDGLESSVLLAPLPLMADLVLYFIIAAFGLWEIRRIRQAMPTRA